MGGYPPNATHSENMALIRPHQGMMVVNNPLMRPYLLGGGGGIGGMPLNSHESTERSGKRLFFFLNFARRWEPSGGHLNDQSKQMPRSIIKNSHLNREIDLES